MFLYKLISNCIPEMTNKKDVITTFRRYLKLKGFKNVKMIQADTVHQIEEPTVGLLPDITAENKGILYFYKYFEGRQNIAELIKDVKTFYRQKSESQNRKLKLKLLVPVKQSDDVIQSLNAHQLEGVGVIRVSPKMAIA